MPVCATGNARCVVLNTANTKNAVNKISTMTIAAKPYPPGECAPQPLAAKLFFASKLSRSFAMAKMTSPPTAAPMS